MQSLKYLAIFFLFSIHLDSAIAQPILLPTYTKEERDQLSLLQEGTLILNKTNNKINYYSNGKWYELTATCSDTPPPPIIENIRVLNNQLFLTFPKSNLTMYASLKPDNIIHETNEQTIIFSNLKANKTYQVEVWAKNECGDGVKSLIPSEISVNPNNNCLGDTILVDNRNQQKYKIVNIATECWMADDLRYIPNNNDKNIIQVAENEVYYNWYSLNLPSQTNNNDKSIKNTVCPIGWHIPTNEDITNLINEYQIAKEDKQYNFIKFWNVNYKDYYDFQTHTNDQVGDRLIIWINKPNTENEFGTSFMISHDIIQTSNLNKSYGLKIRCVKNK